MLLERDLNAPGVKRLIDGLEARGFADPLVTVTFVGDPNGEGRAFMVYPSTALAGPSPARGPFSPASGAGSG